jgi:hypothetical protein
MFVTVVNYLPLIEEETATKKFELVKKQKGETSGSDSEDEQESETETLGFSISQSNYFSIDLNASEHHFISAFKEYSFRLHKTLNPPPKA